MKTFYILYKGQKSVLYFKRIFETTRTVVMKSLVDEYPLPNYVQLIENEYETLSGKNIYGVRKALAMEQADGKPTISLEFIDGVSLFEIIKENKFDFEQKLRFAVELFRIIDGVHQACIVHNNITPRNIIISSKTAQPVLIDFAYASKFDSSEPQRRSLEDMEDILPYLSPEQSGRINRKIDYRTDFYSAAVILYELFTGRLPFDAEDPIKLLHKHIAENPVAPSNYNKQVFPVLDAIILKLLSKNAEDRYLSAYGVFCDLEHCFKQFRDTSFQSDFQIGKHDFSYKFQIPARVYGREAELEVADRIFERVCTGSFELLFVTGHSGIGKTAFVKEFTNKLVRQKAYFIEGKYEINKQDIPYSAFVKAFNEFVTQILSDTEKNFLLWKTAIRNAVGPNGAILTEVIPSFELIIGEQLPVQPLNGLDAQNRFNFVFCNLLSRISSTKRPIVIFLDDIQWIDMASLSLARSLMRSKQIKGVMLVGALKPSEMKTNHYLHSAWSEIIHRPHKVTRLELKSIGLESLKAMLTDLMKPQRDVDEFAKLVLMKTNGNPYFVKQFLTVLTEKRFLYYDRETQSWDWDIESVQHEEITPNVVHLLSSRLKAMHATEASVLQLASCFGTHFRKHDLARLVNLSDSDLDGILHSLKESGYIIGGDDAYEFIHGHVHAAVYRLLDVEKKKQIHFQIGELLLVSIPSSSRDERIFELVNHFNIAGNLVHGASLKRKVYELNYRAAFKAKQLAAFHAFAQYTSICIAQLSGDAWEHDYLSTLSVYLLAAEAAFLSQDFHVMDNYLTEIITQAKEPNDTADAYEIKILSLIAQNKMKEALKLGCSTLRLLDFEFDIELDREQIEREFVALRTRLNAYPLEELRNMPMTDDPRVIGIAKILKRLLLPLYMHSPRAVKVYTLSMVKIMLDHGAHLHTPSSYAMFCQILGERELWDDCRRYFNLSKALQDRSDFTTSAGSTLFIGQQAVAHYFIPLSGFIGNYSKAVNLAIDSGDFVAAGDAASLYIFSLFISGKPITEFYTELTHYRDLVENTRFQLQSSWIVMMYTSVKMIELDAEIEYEIKFDEIKARMVSRNDKLGLAYWYLFRLMKNFIYERLENYQELLDSMQELQQNIRGQYTWYIYRFYETLTLLRCIDSRQQFLAYQPQFDELIERFDKLSKLCPANFSYKLELIKAEYFRVKGDHGSSIKAYENAYTKALEQRLYNDAALSAELAGRYWLEQGINRIAANYFSLAIFNYERWGVVSKVEILKSKYKELFSRREGFNLNSNSKALSANSIDLTSVIKAYQAITSETKIGKLFSKMMNILMENSGAEKGMFILNEEGHWYIRASGDFKTDKFEILDYVVSQAQAKDFNEINIPKTVFNFCLRSKEYLVIEDAQQDSKFGSDEYFERNMTRSVICIPLLNQGKPMGILYLENNLTPGAFTPEKVKMLQLLTSQFSISVENALIYQSLENKVKERTREINELNHHLREVNEELQESNVRLEERQEEVEKQAFELRIANSELRIQKTELVDTLDRLKQTQSKLIQSEKMASLGVLIAGIAHEINNPVNFINANIKGLKLILDEMVSLINQYGQVDADNYAQVLERINEQKEEMDFDGSIKDISTVISNISNGAERTAEIVRSLKAFSYSDDGEKRSIDIHDNIDITLTMLHYKYKNKINIYKTYNPVPKIMCMPGRINQVIMNILTNAIDSINSKELLTENEYINIQTDVVGVDEKNYVSILVKDSGAGIPEKIKDRIFEPFFTTKDVGEGTGLGLSISHGIIQNHNGYIVVEDNPDGGAVFIINLPIEGGN